MRALTALLTVAAAFFPSPASAHPGWGIVVDAQGAVYHTDLKQVWRIAASGGKSVVVPNVHTHELYLDPSGVLLGEHLWYDNRLQKWWRYLWERTPDGRVTRHPAREGFRSDTSLARDRAGRMYWLDGSRLMAREPDQKPRVLAELGREPRGILTVSGDGTAYVTIGGDLVKIAPDGRSARIASGLDEHTRTAFMMQPTHYILGLHVDSADNVYVANAGSRKLKKVTAAGAVSTVLQAGFPWAPCGVTERGGELYVLEYTDTGGSVRVRKVSASGLVRVLK